MAPPLVFWESHRASAAPLREGRTVPFISMLKDLWKRRLLVALAGIVAVAAGVFALNQVNSPSNPEARGSREVLVDSAPPPIAGSKRDITGLIVRAGVFARLMAGGDIVREIAQKAGVPANQIEVVGPQPFPEEVPGAR